jgi:SAM-dependent methyltransferase
VSERVYQNQSRRERLEILSKGLLKKACETRLSRHTLEIRHGSAPSFAPAVMHSVSETFGLSLSFNRGTLPAPGQRIHCTTSELPFQDKVFGIVLLHHVLAKGEEPELAEAVRVLARDGVLIVLGLNHLGWRFRSQKGAVRFPAMAPLKIVHALERMNMTVQGMSGAGLMGMGRPQIMNSGLAGLGLPLADVMLFQARHVDSPEVSQMRFRDRLSGIVQSAPLRG